jgi:hypothetical protein
METSQKEFLMNGINSLLEQIDKVNHAISFHSQLENIDNLVLASYKARKLKYEHELLDLLGNFNVSFALPVQDEPDYIQAA